MRGFVFGVLSLVVAMTLFSSCEETKFTIEANIENMGTQNVRVIYIEDSKVFTSVIPAIDGKFSFNGVSPNYTLFNLIGQSGEALARVVARNGEVLELTGDYKQPHSIKVSGNAINNDYYGFIGSNSELFAADRSEELDSEIAKYIGKNRGNVASTLLLLTCLSDINNVRMVDSLLNIIEPMARVDYLTDYYMSDMDWSLATDSINDSTAIQGVIKPFAMERIDGVVERFDPSNGGKGFSVLYIWDDDTTGHSSRLNSLNSMVKWHKNHKIQVADISLVQDTHFWERVVKRDSLPWAHLQAVGAEFNATMLDMDIRQVPLYIVTDSVGAIRYRGDDLNSVNAIFN